MEDLPLFPLNTVLFPSMPLALHIFEERYKQMIGRCLQADTPFGVVLIREGKEVGVPAVPVAIGTSAQIVTVDKLLQGRMNLVVVGRKRFRLLEVIQKRPYLIGRVEFIPHVVGERESLIGAAGEVRRLFIGYLQIMAALVETEVDIKALPEDAASLAYAVAVALQVENEVKQTLLAADSITQILQREAELLPREIARMRMLNEIEKSRKQTDDSKIGPFSKN